MNWEVRFSAKTKRQAEKLPEAVQRRLKYLVEEIKVLGPVRTNWPNYGKLRGQGDGHHCHLRKGKATYVAVWRVQAEGLRLVEVRYVGTHEKADYRRIC